MVTKDLKLKKKTFKKTQNMSNYNIILKIHFHSGTFLFNVKLVQNAIK